MRIRLQVTAGLLLWCVGLTAGCQTEFPVEYYPNHDVQLTASDSEKGGSGSYGGTNGSYNTVTPGSPAATNGSTAGGAVPNGALNHPTGSLGGVAPADTPLQTGSYSGANVGGGGQDGVGAGMPAAGSNLAGGSAGR